MNKLAPAKPPAGVIVVACLIGIGALFNLGLGLWLGFHSHSDATSSQSALLPLPTWVPLVNGLLSLSLGLLYLAIIRMVFSQSALAYPLIQTMSVINIALSVVRLPEGVVTIGLTAIVLVISNLRRPKEWLTAKVR